ncbi:MAG: hypothetical protein CBD16_08805 [Betaproteobacteria bacterium TMED156]|nr:MAG: hypothetical protein CBD16_08805 [Betaproteobacteria bacterium TMED156]
MPEFATLARPYANALLDISLEKSLDFTKLLETVDKIISNSNFQRYISDPLKNKNLHAKFIMEILGDNQSKEFEKFIYEISINSRLNVLNEIYVQYKKMMNSHNGITNVKIITAFDLEHEELDNLLNKLESKYKKKLEAEVIVDQSLLGGVRIEIGDKVLDGSIRSRINRLKSSLLS